MTTPSMIANRSGESQRSGNRSTPFGMRVSSPLNTVSPITPIRRSLFQKQKRRVTSNKRQKDSFWPLDEDDSKDDPNENENISPLTGSKKKGQQKLKVLRDRFSNMQKGLGSIDEERDNLVEKVKELEKEKQFIQQQLELRENEILTLIKRCASQEEKMRESSKLRSKNRELQNNLQSVERQLQEIEDNKQDRLHLEKRLQESELDRERLKDRLAQVQREHDSITDTLHECLTKIRRLTEEKQVLEEDYRTERKRAEKELEKQYLEHANDSNNLKEDIQKHQSKINEMEKILQDNMKSNTALRREKAAMSQGQQEEIQELVDKYERQLKELQKEIEEASSEKTPEKELGSKELIAEVETMREKMESKDTLLEKLESEFSDQMMMLMSKQSKLDEAEEEKKTLEAKVKSFRQSEIEHAALLDFVQILESNLVELTTTNAHLELEKDELREETDELQRKASLLQQQFSNLRNNNKARENDFRELLNTEKDELRKELEELLNQAQIEALSLQNDLESRNEYISKLETELDNARELIAEKEEEIVRIIAEMESIRSNIGDELKKARIDVASLEAEVFAKDQQLASIEGHLEGAKEIRELEGEIDGGDSVTTENYPLPSEDQALQLNLKETRSEHLLKTLEGTIAELQNESETLQQNIASLLEEKLSLEKTVENSCVVINRRDAQILEMEQTILEYDNKASVLDQQLQKTRKELNDHTNNMQSKVSVADTTLTNLPHKVVDELEERIRILEKELLEATSSRSESATNLRRAQDRIEKLEKKLIGGDARTISLENQLRDATYSLECEESKASLIEDEYCSHAQSRLESPKDALEAMSKISTLEDKIAEMSVEANDLQIQLEQSTKDIATKEEIINSLKLEVTAGRGESETLRSELEIKSTEIKNLEVLLNQKETELQMELKDASVALTKKEDLIKELEELVSKNKGNAKTLQELLAQAQEDIVLLEEEIQCQENEQAALTEELRNVNQNSLLVRTELEQKVRDLTIQLNKSNAILEGERESWIAMENNSKKELSRLTENLLEMGESKTGREHLIVSLQKDLEERENQNLMAENRVSDSNNIISKLEEELNIKDGKIKDLEKQIQANREEEDTFNGSEQRRIEIELELKCANEKIEELTLSLRGREKRLREVGDEMVKTREESMEKDKIIISMEIRCRDLEDKVHCLNGELQLKEESLKETGNELETMTADIREKEQNIESLRSAIQLLENGVEQTRNEVLLQNDGMVILEDMTKNLKLELSKAESELATKGEKIKSLEDEMIIEKKSRINLQDELEMARGNLSESQKIRDDLQNKLEVEKHGKIMLEGKLSDAEKEVQLLNSSSREHISKLESQIIKLKDDVSARDEEALIQKKNNELIEPMKEEVNSLKGQLLQEKLGRESEKKSFSSDLEALQSELRLLSQENISLSEQCDKEIDVRTKSMNALESSKQKLRFQLTTLDAKLDERDATIKELEEIISQGKTRDEVARKDLDALKKSEEETRNRLDNLQAEYELTAKREKGVMERIRKNMNSLHSEELEKTTAELESTLKKLKDVENVLAERSCLLGEVVDHNRGIETKFEKEQKQRLNLEVRLAEERKNVEELENDLRRAQEELTRKESSLESKLHEERTQKEQAEQALKSMAAKYKETTRTRRNMIDMEKENKELKDKIKRQEAYLKRKLEKEKVNRTGLTPRKSIGNPSSTQRTPLKSMTNSDYKPLQSSSIRSRSKLQAPSSVIRSISTDMPLTSTRRRPKVSPSAASYRSGISPKSTTSSRSARSTHFESPVKQTTPLSAQDILQFELGDDESIGSELSSILR